MSRPRGVVLDLFIEALVAAIAAALVDLGCWLAKRAMKRRRKRREEDDQ